jgi:hypothetical protein
MGVIHSARVDEARSDTAFMALSSRRPAKPPRAVLHVCRFGVPTFMADLD